MKIRSITLTGFRCFRDETVVSLDNLTTIIGGNGCGKSAILTALCRMFGVSTYLRTVQRSDFHVPAGKVHDDFEKLTLTIEVILDFPELDGAGGKAIPECFNQMAIKGDGADEKLFCRVKLKATWHRTGLPEGEIEELLQWITTAGDAKEEHLRAVRPHERARIHVIYVPAIRDPASQLKQASGTILGRLMRASNWSVEGKTAIDKAAQSVAKTFRDEQSISLIEKATTAVWAAVQDFPDLAKVQLQPLESRIEDLLHHIEVLFTDSGDKTNLGIDRLSDGLRSLFYFSLLLASFKVEQDAQLALASAESENAAGAEKGSEKKAPAFDDSKLHPPTLTVFAVEEPENHLSAHYLGRIVEKLNGIAAEQSAQVILTSHSPAILGRVDPENVRHLRLVEPERVSRVNPIQLPEKADDAYKYVKEAVRAYPELYFSRLVILGEGDSEEIVLDHLAELVGLARDASAISIVPLGGRFVHHFWKLLTDLDIPYVTLLDLDRERDGGGWGRVKYALAELVAIGVPWNQVLTLRNGDVLTEEQFQGMHDWSLASAEEVDRVASWVRFLENHRVFYCNPLDLDFEMLTAFPDQYRKTGNRGPRLPKSTDSDYVQKYNEKLAAALGATLKGNNTGGVTFTAQEKELFILYAYLFLGQGKPSTHLLALSLISDADFTAKCPEVLKRLFRQVKTLLNVTG